ncbi:hypothetical protein GCM10027187_32150 [Streptosporangium sandarakinum]
MAAVVGGGIVFAVAGGDDPAGPSAPKGTGTSQEARQDPASGESGTRSGDASSDGSAESGGSDESGETGDFGGSSGYDGSGAEGAGGGDGAAASGSQSGSGSSTGKTATGKTTNGKTNPSTPAKEHQSGTGQSSDEDGLTDPRSDGPPGSVPPLSPTR